ncbi:hypothetical protein [Breznakiella homolactica]|uniref:Uncharacterized protein n=1 Tax=Breznakiella homolactica TaxID=2798577 RepID=A0A7T7XR36_9SPIR|nr:hypothetical protein [Breznakiella homolactica]QQO10931.1 hypothetical protein JFL75_08445 [Breznakiella homolactica]
MGIRNRRRVSFFFMLSFLFTFAAAAQETPVPGDVPLAAPQGTAAEGQSSSYYIQETDEGIRFIQRLEWEPVEHILDYEIVIEQRFGNSDRYYSFMDERIEDPYIELSLPPGNYRYKILVYNVLNRIDGESEWVYFNVFLAVQPQVDSYTPRYFYLDEPEERRISIRGNNFVRESEMYLMPALREGETEQSLRERGRIIIPRDITYTDIGDGAEIFLNEQDLLTYTYNLVIVNPGGLSTIAGPISVLFQKPMDLNIHAGYSPMFPLYGKPMYGWPGSDGGEDDTVVYEGVIYPVSFNIRITFIPFKKVYGYFGVELSPYYVFNKASNEAGTYTASSHNLGVILYAVYQKPLVNRKYILNVRAGGGISSYLNMYFDYGDNLKSPSFDTWFPVAAAGASFQWYFYKRAFVDFGVEFMHYFVTDMPTGFIRPSITAGWQF